MASRTPMAINTKKARMMSIKEANYIATTGIMAEYQQGFSAPPAERIADMKHAREMRDYYAWKLLYDAGVICDSCEKYGIIHS